MNKRITYTYWPSVTPNDWQEMDRNEAMEQFGPQTIAHMEALLHLRPDDTIKISNSEGELMVENEQITDAHARGMEANAE